MKVFGADEVGAFGPAAAVQAISDALRAGLDPAADPPRTGVRLSRGQCLLMPAEAPAGVGVKVVTVASGNSARGLPRIQGAFLLFDGRTLALRAVLDGAALTALRTPAVSVAAVLPRLPDRSLRVVAVGAGPQATGHVAALAAVRPLAARTYLVRDPARTPLPAVPLGSPQAEQELRTADIVVCATSARSPVFDSALLRGDVVVIAVGSHEPEARELDAALLGRATVVVEDVATALREAGDVVLAVADGTVSAPDLLPIRDVVTGAASVRTGRPLVFKSVGMAWEDLVVAQALVTAAVDS